MTINYKSRYNLLKKRVVILKFFSTQKDNIFLMSLQESFIAIVPYFVLSSVLILFLQLVNVVDLGFYTKDSIQYFTSIIEQFSCMVVLFSISYHFALRYGLNIPINVFLSVLVFSSAVAMNKIYTGNPNILFSGLNLITLSTPIITTFVFKAVLKYIQIQKYDLNYPHILRVFSYMYPFFITYFIILGFMFFVFEIYSLYSDVEILTGYLSDSTWLLLKSLLSQLFWFVGIHGPHMFNAIFDTSFLENEIFPNLTYQNFYRIFALSGGSGVGLSLLIALILNKDEDSMKIAKLAAPFVVFNINTILIFGIPIVFNRFLFIPFIITPLINLFIGYIALSVLPIHFVHMNIQWTTPVFIDSYLLTDGNLFLPVLQLFLISLGVLVYYPFIKKYLKTQSIKNHLKTLEEKLDIVAPLKAKEHISAYKMQQEIIKSNYKLEQIITMLNKESLMVYYQPKVDIQKNECNFYEALLRLRISEDKVVGPFFLEDLEKAGLAVIIDLWVVKRVKEDIENWKKEGFYPKISVNLHPDTLQNTEAICEIIDILQEENIEFEIIERSFLNGTTAKNNLILLKENNFQISIDDFGVGYSSLETLSSYNIDSLKVDKSLIDNIHKQKGYLICKHIINLCHSLNIECIAEGVETKEQMELLKYMRVKFIQGYYYSKAIPAKEILTYKPKKD